MSASGLDRQYPRLHSATIALRNTVTITARNLRRLVRVPTHITFATAQPVLFVLLFTYAFGGAVHPPGIAHDVDFLLRGVIVLAIGFGGSQTGSL